MVNKENTDELVVVDAKRYNRVKKALEEGKTGEPGAAPPIMDENESTRELVVVDVRRYKKVKKALEASEERYRQLFENVPIGIYRTTPDGRIIDSNPALVKMLGYDSFAELADAQPGEGILAIAGYEARRFHQAPGARRRDQGAGVGLEKEGRLVDPGARERQADAQRGGAGLL